MLRAERPALAIICSRWSMRAPGLETSHRSPHQETTEARKGPHRRPPVGPPEASRGTGNPKNPISAALFHSAALARLIADGASNELILIAEMMLAFILVDREPPIDRHEAKQMTVCRFAQLGGLAIARNSIFQQEAENSLESYIGKARFLRELLGAYDSRIPCVNYNNAIKVFRL